MARTNEARALRSPLPENAKSGSFANQSPAFVDSDGSIDSASHSELRRARIAEAAYYRSLQRGDGPGSALEDWLAAEEEVDLQLLLY